MSAGSIAVGDAPLLRHALERADDALVLGHRLSEWCGHAPMMEEDMALSNTALDLLGQARALYTYAAAVEGAGRTEDDYAYLRDERDYRNLLLVEQPNGDFAVTSVRQYLYAAFMTPYWQAMTASTDATLAAIAAKAQKESAYHLRHAGEWMIRLGDGTDESHARAQQALDALWPFTGELFMPSAAEQALSASGVVVDPSTLASTWRDTVAGVIAQATLTVPADTWMQRGGREGRHSEHLGHLLAELQHLQRSHPGATW
jgi:ring-1,2-phenylacetyl-CoA epoxidase subunit PaaC